MLFYVNPRFLLLRKLKPKPCWQISFYIFLRVLFILMLKYEKNCDIHSKILILIIFKILVVPKSLDSNISVKNY